MTQTISDRIYEALSRRIVTGELAAGEKLRQDHIAQEFDTSHVPVREALLMLVAHGLANSQPRRGVRVAEFDPSEHREIVEMRVALEVIALQNAGPRLSPDVLRRAEAARVACDAAQDINTWEVENRAFHRTILEPCKMPRLMAAIDDLHIAAARQLFAHWSNDWEQRTDHDHRAILSALKRGDTGTACDILRRHLRRMS
ncbi:GntR family HTH-type transcriptional regulator [Actibacterium atlanticum]|uniref:GntR family HTH-type transcriptional regulator n=1 Tax=Actibacterium atlanticum TaxID=1461693 RepID=A0A058ZP85_9RHOB|nr:GntR family transcriptional regulator [Actibacterium atlanticum]KCV82631.1 GntR family HTH-type transcriptional regulator [Actibacterium atlanticum]